MRTSEEVIGVFSTRPWTAAACIAARGATASPATRSCFQLEDDPDEWDHSSVAQGEKVGCGLLLGCELLRARERGERETGLWPSCVFFFFDRNHFLFLLSVFPKYLGQNSVVWKSNEVQIF